MPRFSDVDVFVAVARERSFRGAAGELGVTKSTVSRAIRRLEAHLGATLVARDQRSLRLTDAGAAYLRFAEAASRSLVEGEQAVALLAGDVVGTVRVSAPTALGQAQLARLCGDFLRAHPLVSVDLVLTDQVVNLTSDAFDLVVRAGPRLTGAGLKVRRLASAPMVAVATPERAASLAREETVPWIEFAYPGRDHEPLPLAPASLSGRLRVDDYLALKEAVLAGHGIGVMSELLVSRELIEGRLVRVLADWRLPTANYWALFPGSGPMPARTRALLDHLVQGFARWAAPVAPTNTDA